MISRFNFENEKTKFLKQEDRFLIQTSDNKNIVKSQAQIS